MERDTDPRKKYAIKKKKCENLPEYIKMHKKECKKEFKDYVVRHRHVGPMPRPHPSPPGPKPDPHPHPHPGPGPGPGPIYTRHGIPLGYEYAVGGALAGRAAARLGRRGLAERPEGAYEPVERDDPDELRAAEEGRRGRIPRAGFGESRGEQIRRLQAERPSPFDAAPDLTTPTAQGTPEDITQTSRRPPRANPPREGTLIPGEHTGTSAQLPRRSAMRRLSIAPRAQVAPAPETELRDSRLPPPSALTDTSQQTGLRRRRGLSARDIVDPEDSRTKTGKKKMTKKEREELAEREKRRVLRTYRDGAPGRSTDPLPDERMSDEFEDVDLNDPNEMGVPQVEDDGRISNMAQVKRRIQRLVGSGSDAMTGLVHGLLGPHLAPPGAHTYRPVPTDDTPTTSTTAPQPETPPEPPEPHPTTTSTTRPQPVRNTTNPEPPTEPSRPAPHPDPSAPSPSAPPTDDIASEEQQISELTQRIRGAQQAVSARKLTLSDRQGALATEDQAIDTDLLQVGQEDLASTGAERGTTGVEWSGADESRDVSALDFNLADDNTALRGLGLLGTVAKVGGTVAKGALLGAKVATAPIRIAQKGIQMVGTAAGGALERGAIATGSETAIKAVQGIRAAAGFTAAGLGLIEAAGEYNPFVDVVGLASMAAGPLYNWNMKQYDKQSGNVPYQGIDGTTKLPMGSLEVAPFMKNLNNQIETIMSKSGLPKDQTHKPYWTANSIKQVPAAHNLAEYSQEIMTAMEMNVAGKGNVPVMWKNTDPNNQGSGVVVPMNKRQLAQAINLYQQNPDAFKGVNPMALQVMGLNPNMSQGAAGAQQVTQNGKTVYMPKNFQTGNNPSDSLPTNHMYQPGKFGTPSDPDKINYSDAYVSYGNWTKVQGANSDQQYFSSTTPSIKPDPNVYASDMMNVIQSTNNGDARKYLLNRLAWYKYNNGIGPKPTDPKMDPPSSAQAQQALTDATNNLNSLQNQLENLKTKISQQAQPTEMTVAKQLAKGVGAAPTTAPPPGSQGPARVPPSNTANRSIATAVPVVPRAGPSAPPTAPPPGSQGPARGTVNTQATANPASGAVVVPRANPTAGEATAPPPAPVRN